MECLSLHLAVHLFQLAVPELQAFNKPIIQELKLFLRGACELLC